MNNSYDYLISQLILELDHEYPNMLKLQSIIKESNCPYLKEIVLTKVNAFKNKLPSKKKKDDL
ncbi:MAG: hypothetical protein MI921_11380 [Cytophagales bacterium]|nr:hypothetical protein [Cytophagales bacterium]